MNPFRDVRSLPGRIKHHCISYFRSLVRYEDRVTASLYENNDGFLVRWIMGYLSSRINLETRNLEKIRQIPLDAIVVFTVKNKRTSDFLYLHTKLKLLETHFPSLGFDYNFFFFLPLGRGFRIISTQLRYFFRHFRLRNIYDSQAARNLLLSGHSGCASLIEKEDFYDRFIRSTPDPLFHLIEMQKEIKRPIFMVPLDILYVSKPMRKDPGLFDLLFGAHDNPGRIKRLFTLLRHPETVQMVVANPINLTEFISDPSVRRLDSEFQSHRLRTCLVGIINRQIKSFTGPVLKSRQEITEDILTRKSMKEYLAQYAAEKNLSLKKTNKKAADYINEIAANYNLRIINIGSVVLNWAFQNIFDELMVDPDQISRMKEKSTESPLVLIPCHKSHLDYLLLPYVMHKNNMPCPHIAAGKNLSFWPLGPIFRGGGAFFIRRTIKGAQLYARIFAAYLEKLLYEGFNLKIFIEGGRSRTGKLLSPRPGGISFMIRACLSGACNDLYFVPIFIGYDRVLEEDAYLKEREGGEKKPENIKGLLAMPKFLKRQYGKVYIRFDEPISIKEYMEKKHVDATKMSEQEYIAFVKQFGYKLIHRINCQAVATPHGIVAAAILNCPAAIFSKAQIGELVNIYIELLSFHGAELSDTLVMDPDNTLDTVINNFVDRKFIELADEDEEEIVSDTHFIVKHNKRPILDYYKNSVISFFVPSAYVAVAILETDRFQFALLDLIPRYKFLQKLFVDEFSFDEDLSCEDQIAMAIKGFVNQGFLVPAAEGEELFDLTSSGRREMKMFAAFMLPFFESYLTVLTYLEKEKHESQDIKGMAKKVLSLGSKLYKRKQIRLKESISLVTYQNALRVFCTKNIPESEEEDKKARKERNTREKQLLESNRQLLAHLIQRIMN